MMRDMMVGILAGVGLVVHQEALIAEPKILDQDRVAGKLLIAAVSDLGPPEPRVQARVQPEGDPMAGAAALSFPHIAIVRSADAKPWLGAHHGQNRRLKSAQAQIKAPHAVGDRQGERLIDHDATVGLRVLNGEDRPAWQDTDRKPCVVSDPQKAEIVSARRRQDLD